MQRPFLSEDGFRVDEQIRSDLVLLISDMGTRGSFTGRQNTLADEVKVVLSPSDRLMRNLNLAANDVSAARSAKELASFDRVNLPLLILSAPVDCLHCLQQPFHHHTTF